MKKIISSLFPKGIDSYLKPSFFLLLIALLQIHAFAQPANIIIQPSPHAVSGTVGTNFTVSVRVDFTNTTPGPGADAVEVHLTFDNLKLQVVSAINVSTLTTVAIPFASIAAINAAGQIDYAAGGAAVTTDFNFIDITFQVVGGAGTSTPLTYLTAFPNTTDVSNTGASILNLPDGTIDGTVIINPLACTPPAVVISGVAGCDGGDITLTLASSSAGTAPFDLTINGTTYPAIAVGAPILPVPFTVPTQSVFPSNPIPAFPTENDASLYPPGIADVIETGMRFQSSVDGFVKGVRFYNGANNAGTYTGNLYTNTGTLLASMVFTGVTTSAWQQATFTTPVFITGGTTYVVSVLSSLGYYAATRDVFDVAITSGNLTGLAGNSPENASAVPGTVANGIYRYGGGFPGVDPPGPPPPPTNNNFDNTSYFVDVVFTPESFTFDLTVVTDAALPAPCTSTGTPLQSLVVTSVDCSTLPVSLVNLSATPQGNKITLRWTTETEINNRGFDIQRSNDGVNWTTISFVAGAGNSSSTKNYTYADANLVARRYYYRLKQIDIDERFKYSAIVSATLSGKSGYLLAQNYPNPFSSGTTIQFTIPKAEKVNLSLFDVSGRIVKVLVNGSKDEGTHAIPLNAGSLTRGVYYYKIQSGDFTDVKKLTIQ